MAKYFIDANLPYYFALWSNKDCIHANDIDDEWSDFKIWEYAKENNLTIVTKDADFSEMILPSEPPPRIIHVKLGNMKMNQFHNAISKVWNEACELSDQYKLVRIFEDRIECIN
ncbi:DUF5615 family PIN-like protein [candidate division KSB1 bacterium]|nr:DUF5615 family PIN-like protein [candidate division KSB1 bacterium]